MSSIVTKELPASTGIAGLDDIMVGGFTRRRLYLVEVSQVQARRRWPCNI
jgi:hypothetical protein